VIVRTIATTNLVGWYNAGTCNVPLLPTYEVGGDDRRFRGVKVYHPHPFFLREKEKEVFPL